MARVKTGGRQKGTLNKSTRELRFIAGMYAPEAIKTMVQIMRNSDNDTTRLKACQMILDRSHGAPKPYFYDINEIKELLVNPDYGAIENLNAEYIEQSDNEE